MPETELPKFGYGVFVDSAQLYLYLTSLMYFPHDEKMRTYARTLEDTRSSTYMRPGEERLSVDIKTLRALTDAPSYPDIQVLRADALKQGVIAGDVLLSLYFMAASGVEEPSINKAIHMFQQYAPNAMYGDDSKVPVSERKIRESWDRYKPVAHLWAAFRCNQGAPAFPVEATFQSWGNMMFLLRLAATFQEFGCSFVPKRARPAEPILDRETLWTLPAWIVKQAIRLNPTRIPEQINKMLRGYSAP